MKVDTPYLVLIQNSIEQIFTYLSGIDKEKFLQNDLLKDACLTRLMVIGEYSGKVSEVTKNRFPDVEWQQMKVARNFYIHDYGKINWEMVWETIQTYLPALKPKIETILFILAKEER